MADKFTDILTYVLSVALAGAVIAFAAYKVVKLNGMENPPANLGLNFPPAQRKVIMDDPSAGDPITTRSLPSPGVETAAPRRRLARRMSADGLYAYELLTVIDGVAFVAVDTDAEKTLVPVTVGTKLPGGLRVDAISRDGGRWALVAGNLRLEQEAAPVQ